MEESRGFSASPKRKGERKQWVWIMLMVNIVFVLLIMTIGIIALRVGNYLPEGTDILFIVGKNPSVEVGDEEGKSWKAQKEVNIFRAEYKNGEGETTVVSQDGTKLIAPGVETKYQFTMYNNGNMAVFYETDLDFFLKIGDVVQKEYEFPLEVRLFTESAGYIIGSDTAWVNVKDAKLSQHVSVLGAMSYETFDLQLRWQFEGGNDELDTMYGNASAEKGVTLTLGINTYAEQHFDPTTQGGIKLSEDEDGQPEYGGTIRWLWLVLLFLNAAILVFYVSWLMNKRLRKW